MPWLLEKAKVSLRVPCPIPWDFLGLAAEGQKVPHCFPFSCTFVSDSLWCCSLLLVLSRPPSAAAD